MRPALLVVDMLNDFLYGSLACEHCREIVPRIRRLIEIARRVGAPVIFVNDSHEPGVDRELGMWGPHAVRGSWGSRVVDELDLGYGYTVFKRRYSGFFETDLDLLLRELGIDTLVVTGIHTHICVLFTVADAVFRGYSVAVVRDCVAAFDREWHEKTLEYMQRFLGVEIVDSGRAEKILESYSPRS